MGKGFAEVATGKEVTERGWAVLGEGSGEGKVEEEEAVV